MAADLDPALVPELLVTDLDDSLAFWSTICGFTVRYSRPDERLAYLTYGSARVTLEQAGVGRNWIRARLDPPFGRGINLQITVPNVAAVATALDAAEVNLFTQPETKWYLIADEEAGVHPFLVTDSDGYLLRFASSAGRRRAVR